MFLTHIKKIRRKKAKKETKKKNKTKTLLTLNRKKLAPDSSDRLEEITMEISKQRRKRLNKTKEIKITEVLTNESVRRKGLFGEV